MMLAQRIRDHRYAKGWGPDELANRASISRTALYQIESGKTEQPRAGTLRRIAEALSISTEALLGQGRSIEARDAVLAGPVEVPRPRLGTEVREESDLLRMASTPAPALSWPGSPRERDLVRKFHEILRSPFGEGVARIVEESYRILPNRVESVR